MFPHSKMFLKNHKTMMMILASALLQHFGSIQQTICQSKYNNLQELRKYIKSFKLVQKLQKPKVKETLLCFLKLVLAHQPFPPPGVPQVTMETQWKLVIPVRDANVTATPTPT